MNGWRELWEAAVLELRYQDAIACFSSARPVDRARWHYGMELAEGYAALEWREEDAS